MKLRMRQNSIRLRLTRSEVALFAETGHMEEAVAFPSETLRYTLERSNATTLRADFVNGSLTVSMPEAAARLWASTAEVGVEGRCGKLEILIEKDFQCAHGAVDDDAFAFEGDGIRP